MRCCDGTTAALGRHPLRARGCSLAALTAHYTSDTRDVARNFAGDLATAVPIERALAVIVTRARFREAASPCAWDHASADPGATVRRTPTLTSSSRSTRRRAAHPAFVALVLCCACVERARVSLPVKEQGGLALSSCESFATGARAAGDAPCPVEDLTIVVVGALRGTLEPCGCASHPKGGVHRLGHVAQEVRRRARGALVLSAGDLLYENSPSTPRGAQERAKAETLVQALGLTGLFAAARGPLDDGPEASTAPWKSLVPGAGGFAVTEAAGVKVGVVAADPHKSADARTAMEAATRAGARVLILLVRGNVGDAKALASRAPGADFAIAGVSQSAGLVPERAGRTVVLEVGSLGEQVGLLSLSLPQPGGQLEDGEPAREALVIADVRLQRARLRLAQLTKQRALAAAVRRGTPAGEDELVRFTRRLLEEAREARAAAQRALATQRPVGRNHFRWRLVTLDRRIPDEPRLLALRHAYKRRLRELNLREAHRFRAPVAPPGTATFVGSATCGACHPGAVSFWRRTAHGRAFATLVREQSDYDLGCVGCHVTGYLAPGGSSLSERPELRDVGCESCHGPGSLHAAARAEDKKTTIVRSPAESVCRQCHTPEHSDLFDFERYRARQIGPGHGAPLVGGAR